MPRKKRDPRPREPKPGATPATTTPREESAAAPVLREGVKVSAVKVHRGPPATTIHVEVDREKVRATVGDDQLEEVLARVPAQDGDAPAPRWADERLEREAGDPGRPARYSKTHYGATDAARYGVGVIIKTRKGSVEAPAQGEVRETDKPEGSHPHPGGDATDER